MKKSLYLAISIASLFSVTSSYALDRAPPKQITGPITIIGPGTTGDVSATTANPDGNAPIGTLASRLAVLPGLKQTFGDFVSKVQAGTAQTICAQGDSITYSQDTVSATTLAPANGAIQRRSATPYPETLAAALTASGISNVTVINRGFPGDSTIEGESRWRNATTCGLTILMYGHNDANNYGGAAHGPVPVSAYRNNMRLMIERELARGSAVIVMLPPSVGDVAQNAKIRPYATAAKRLAEEYGLNWIDTTEQLRWQNKGIWTDGVHLTSSAYADIGWSLSALILGRGESLPRATDGTFLYPQSMIGYGGNIIGAGGTRTGQAIQLAAGATLSIPIYAETDLYPVLTLVNNAGDSERVRSDYAGGKAGIPEVVAVNNGQPTNRSSTTLQRVGRGYRTLNIFNDGSNTSYIESLSFVGVSSAAKAHAKRPGRVVGVAGMTSPRAGLGASEWWAAADYGRLLSSGMTISALVTLDGAAQNGINLLANQQQEYDYVSSSQIMVLRSGTGLIIRNFVNGAASDTSFAGVFAAGTQTGKLEVKVSTTTLTVFWNGSQIGQISNPSISSGYPGIISLGPSDLACLAMVAWD